MTSRQLEQTLMKVTLSWRSGYNDYGSGKTG
jgi:hypothetical protein